MSPKAMALAAIEDLPAEVSWQEIEDRIVFIAAIESARQQVREGKTVPHENLRDLLEQWVSN